MVVLLLFTGVVFAETRLCGYEPWDESVSITTIDTSASVTVVAGGTAGAPFPTEGDYLLKIDCGHEADEKVEVRHTWDTLTFDLAGNDRILFDVYVPSSMMPILYCGVWDDVFGFSSAMNPLVADQWMTVEVNASGFNDTGLDHIWAIYFQDWAADDQTIYMDNLRLLSFTPDLKTVTGQEKAIEVYWENMDNTVIANIDGYNVYRRPSSGGAWTKIANQYGRFVYIDFVGSNGLSYDYKVTSVVDGVESPDSNILSAASVAQTDAEFIETLQRATFRYFWDYAHPVSGLAKADWTENTANLGASGMGIQAIIAGAENGYITRTQAARRTLKIMRFFDTEAQRFHGAWSHYINGASGEVIPFSEFDDGGDLGESFMLIQALIVAKQYYTGADAVETEIRTRADSMWRTVDFNWYRRMPETDGNHLYWHWSPNYGWQINMRIEGWMELFNLYVLAIASPTNGIPASCYHDGWMGPDESWFYYDGLEHYGRRIWAGVYGCSFVYQMPFMCFDPDIRDNVCNYFDNAKNWTLRHRDFCIENPNNYTDYGPNEWGFSADPDPDPLKSYIAHGPDTLYSPDNGTISTTAILASMPYTPVESTAAARHIYDKYEDDMYGAFGFKDSYNRNENWFSNTMIGINMGTNFAMIENYRSRLFWDLYMADADIQRALDEIGFAKVEAAGMDVEYYEGSWTSIPDFDSLTPLRTEVASVPMAYIRNREDNYGLRFSGYLDIETFGSYTFYTNSEDGSKLYIDDQLVVNNDGIRNSPRERSGSKNLVPGKAKIVVDYFNATGDHFLEVSYSGPGITKQVIPVTKLFRCDAPPDDLNNDCGVNMLDFAILADNWLNGYDLNDLASMASNWLD
jgi:hypothetical protein